LCSALLPGISSPSRAVGKKDLRGKFEGYELPTA
jgi:hypothetical protein